VDVGYTFATATTDRIMVYAPPGYEPPDTIVMSEFGVPVTAHRLSDRSLECRDAPTYVDRHGNIKPCPGHCTDENCHRRELGKCQCGRHPGRVPFERAMPG
jgi:hypothetical protein